MSSDYEFQWSMAELVPHAGRMRLLDGVLDSAGEALRAELTIAADQLFFDSAGTAHGVGAWVGVEYMAQAVAAWAGVQERRSGGTPRIGFLLGCRRYQSSRDSFALGERLLVLVQREFEADNGMSQFDCRIEIDGQQVARAQLTVFAPDDLEGFMKRETKNE